MLGDTVRTSRGQQDQSICASEGSVLSALLFWRNGYQSVDAHLCAFLLRADQRGDLHNELLTAAGFVSLEAA